MDTYVLHHVDNAEKAVRVIAQPYLDKLHALQPTVDSIHQLDEDIWGVEGSVAPHVDGTEENRTGWVTQGLIIHAECTTLVTEQELFRLLPGSIYRINPRIMHGTRMTRTMRNNYMIFLAWDFPVELEMPPHEFTRRALDSLFERHGVKA